MNLARKNMLGAFGFLVYIYIRIMSDYATLFSCVVSQPVVEQLVGCRLPVVERRLRGVVVKVVVYGYVYRQPFVHIAFVLLVESVKKLFDVLSVACFVGRTGRVQNRKVRMVYKVFYVLFGGINKGTQKRYVGSVKIGNR